MKTLYKDILPFAGIFGAVVLLSGCASNENTNSTGITSQGGQYRGVIYSDGAVVGQDGRECVCRGGQWQPTGGICDTNVTLLIQGDALVGNTVYSVAEGQKPLVIPSYVPQYLEFFHVNPSSLALENVDPSAFWLLNSDPPLLEIVNKCADCIDADYVWTPAEGKPIVRIYRVCGYSETFAKPEGVTGYCIGEFPCR
jgi:hypothetical protein